MDENTAMGKVGQSYGQVVDRMRVLHQDLLNLKQSIGTSAGFQGHPDQAFGHLTYAQHGEDLIFLNLFALLGIERPRWLDIGAHHPTIISNTALLYRRGGRGVNVEANPHLIEFFNQERPDDVNLNVGVAPNDRAGTTMTYYMLGQHSGLNTFDRAAAEQSLIEHPNLSITGTLEIEVVSIDSIIAKYCHGQYPDLLTIDIENLDYDVLVSADFSRSKPKIICVETGRKTAEICALLTGRGYFVVTRTIGNYIFADGALRGRLW